MGHFDGLFEWDSRLSSPFCGGLGAALLAGLGWLMVRGAGPALLALLLLSRTTQAFLEEMPASGSRPGLKRLLSNESSAGYCERKTKPATSLASWSLSTESLIGVLPVDPAPENYIRVVRNCIFSVVYPTPFKSRTLLVAVSKNVLEDILDLDLSVSKTNYFIQLVSGEKIVSGSIPLAHRYGGHQFGIWADQLGDGRAHIIGIYTNRYGEKWELQLKGSGKTPYSRNGDGRAVLRSSVREFLASEALHYLGIPTSRALSLVVSDDDVWRDPFYNGNIQKERGAIVLRIAKSWFRIGSLEILAHYGELDLLSFYLFLFRYYSVMMVFSPVMGAYGSLEECNRAAVSGGSPSFTLKKLASCLCLSRHVESSTVSVPVENAGK